MKVLILATGQPSKHLINALEERGHTWEHHNPNHLYMLVSDSTSGYDRLYNGHSDLETPVRLLARNYDAVISRIGSSIDHGASILRHLNENLGIYSAQTADGIETASNKLKTTQKLSLNGVRVPITTYAKSPVHTDWLIDKTGGLPTIAKLLRGSQGVGVFILETPQAANTTLESFYKLEASIKLQQFIDAGSKDIRVIVVGDQVVASMERTGKKDFRANISQGGSGAKIKLNDEDKELCVKAAKSIGLEFCGVDLLKDKNGKSYVVEINSNMGTHSISVCGNWFVDLVKHIEQKSKKYKKENIKEEKQQIKNTFESTSSTIFSQTDKEVEELRNSSISRRLAKLESELLK
ncbi:RimK family alpha-L-glutamate ligase [Telluribacter sp.]|jgi:ribosomal protein S6--L-glutamate ligase|uniref:ATP-grasp domain-containing protein n=1 Tax=Telluribacter sp. TaxID=1978767 RepID=UPI002E0D432C|nr:RimK family alpha-L-glutamate ligase [Telluribacter sp.]